jgi:hypothetical protein
MRNSQAAVSGIQPADTIIRLGALDINNVGDLIKVMNAPDVGDVVDTDLVGKPRLSGQTTLARRRPSSPPPEAHALTGVVVADVTRVSFWTGSVAILASALLRADSNVYNLCSFLRVTSFSFTI